ncbi:hypoxanthine phosphoribosyltransferase [Pedobacter sp. W3I1]|uniref:phosphoribosyltransferase n=1 Tax=Pedobacter sp. W3I1 TaxID=3042291 RepID=UPI0027846C06|nr:phosphoribosyltransferase family protein [Pedobacter sp. W3I1]MDQ0640063.1 hypoxanthine phosphoribosyltransferase [Pedobacter sp. W3I1]
MQYRSLVNLNEQIVRNIHQIPENIDLIVGIPRSGLLAANLIALHLNLPVTDLQSFVCKLDVKSGNRVKHLIKPLEEYRNILVVDDSLLTGKAMNEARLSLQSQAKSTNITYLAVFIVKEAIGLIDLYFDICPFPRVSEWNLMHHNFLESCVMDIDGVLCVDPTDDENDDGLEYAKFIANARTLFRPSVRIGALIKDNRFRSFLCSNSV